MRIVSGTIRLFQFYPEYSRGCDRCVNCGPVATTSVRWHSSTARCSKYTISPMFAYRMGCALQGQSSSRSIALTITAATRSRCLPINGLMTSGSPTPSRGLCKGVRQARGGVRPQGWGPPTQGALFRGEARLSAFRTRQLPPSIALWLEDLMASPRNA